MTGQATGRPRLATAPRGFSWLRSEAARVDERGKTGILTCLCLSPRSGFGLAAFYDGALASKRSTFPHSEIKNGSECTCPGGCHASTWAASAGGPAGAPCQASAAVGCAPRPPGRHSSIWCFSQLCSGTLLPQGMCAGPSLGQRLCPLTAYRTHAAGLCLCEEPAPSFNSSFSGETKMVPRGCDGFCLGREGGATLGMPANPMGQPSAEDLT